MAALARWCYRHKWTVVLFWVLALFGVGIASNTVGSNYANVFQLPGTESAKVLTLMDQAFPNRSGEADSVVWHTDSGSVNDAAVKDEMTAALAKVAKLPDVGSVASPYDAQGAGRISKDGRTAYATVTWSKLGNELTVDQVNTFVDTARAPDSAAKGLEVEVGGQAVQQAEQPPMGLSEIVGIAAAAIVLYLAFGSLFGMLLPILTAVFGVGTSVSAIALLSHGMDLGDIAPTLASLVGLGVGIDYALFIVTRHRKGILRGLAPEEAAVKAVNTSGRAVLFAGGTVCIALLGMYAVGLKFLDGLAVSAVLTVVLTVAASVTLLPSMLGVLGMRVLSRRQRKRLAQHGPESEEAAGAAARWSGFVQRHPRVLGVIAVVVMAALAIPALSLRLGSSDQGNNQASTSTRQAYDLLADGFGPGFNGPLTILAEVPGGAGDVTALDGLVADIRKLDGVAAVNAVPVKAGATVAVVQVVPTTSPQAVQTDELIDRLRDGVIPAAEKGSTMQAYVGGQTAIFKDFAHVIMQKLPLFIGIIIALGFVLLMLAFRSIIVPLTAAAMNLVAAAAAFGVLVAAFQWGWGGDLLSAGRAGPIDSFIPVIMLSLLFGLSMDYQVFLVSRMHEEWVHTRDNARAVRVGLAETSRVINSAAVIMICVFGAFALSGVRVLAMFGIGLAGAVALDAFVLRTVLVPSLMHLFGDSNWWLPAWLDKRLPHMAVEPADEEQEPLDEAKELVPARD